MSTPLRPLYFSPLPFGGIRPEGWLRRQLELQANSLSGHLDEVWPDIRDSRWFGGDSEGWERAPYWLDGLVPLAYLLDDPLLIAKVTRYMDYILTHQQSDGWLGPLEMKASAAQHQQPHYDLWGQILVLKVLVQYYEGSGDERAVTALEHCLRKIDQHIDREPLFNWGQFRWFEALIAIYWLYEKQPEQWLIDLAVKLHAQGFHWGDFFQRWPLTKKTPYRRWNYAGHVVNNAMAIKAHGLWYRLTGAEADREAPYRQIDLLERYHGMVTGMFSGDECLAGKEPTQGTELCAVVEYTYSLEVLLSLFGDPALADRLEQVIYNALPATFSPDMWAHQYDQQVNQVMCSTRSDYPWTTNGPESNLFGLEPNYGCCTANLSQGWPKFAAHLWMKTTDGGLAAAAYAPCAIDADIQGVAVTARLATDYPFRSELHFTIQTTAPVDFPLYLRIPAWAEDAALTVAGETSQPQPGSFTCIQRTWDGETHISLVLPASPRLLEGYRGARSLARGALVFSLPLGEDWRQVHTDWEGREPPHADWEVYPTTPWNYALQLGPEFLDRLVFEERPVGALPFSPTGAPLRVKVNGKRLPGWDLNGGSAAEAPSGLVESAEPLETLELIPYGCTNLRITEFPLLK